MRLIFRADNDSYITHSIAIQQSLIKKMDISYQVVFQ